MADETGMQGYQYRPVVLEAFGNAELVYVQRDGENRFYIPVAHVCAMLGVTTHGQIERMAEDGRFTLKDMPVQTRGGKQIMPCLWSKEAALLVVTVAPKRCKASVRDRLEEIQQAIMDEATRLLWGDLSSVPQDRQLQRPMRGEVFFDCPRCGAGCCLVVEGVHVTVRIA